MFTAATLALLGPILGGGTIGQAVMWLGSPAGKACKLVLREAIKSFGRPLTEAQQVRLARHNYASRFALYRHEYNNYIETGVMPERIVREFRQKAVTK